MTDQLAEEAKDGYRGPKTSDRCKKALSAFRINRATNINSDLPLARACKADAEKLCANRPTVCATTSGVPGPARMHIPSKPHLPPEKQYTCHTYLFTLLATYSSGGRPCGPGSCAKLS